jgi:hypothetical protein
MSSYVRSHAGRLDDGDVRVHWTLRLGAVLCFLGHGAFGLIGKSGWVPYFDVVGIGPATSWRLMPLVGAIDILLASLILLQPRPAFLGYMTIWAVWTALLRPLAREPFWEALERAGNYGVPLALLATQSQPIRWLARLGVGRIDQPKRTRLERILLATVVLLLVGHAGLALTLKAELVRHYALIDAGRATSLCRASGMFELALAILMIVVRRRWVAALIFLWKVATESLFLLAGSPVWEIVERAGSFAAPLALALLLTRRFDTSAEPDTHRTA